MTELANSLKMSKSLTKLVLHDCMITEDVADLFADLFRCSNDLRDVNMSYNHCITKKGMHKIVDSLRESYITEFCISSSSNHHGNNGPTPKEMKPDEEIEKIIGANKVKAKELEIEQLADIPKIHDPIVEVPSFVEVPSSSSADDNKLDQLKRY